MNDLSVVEMQEEMKQLPQAQCPVKHYFADGCYARELTIPAGVMLAGALHKTYHHFVLSQGKIFVKNGDQKQILEAPYHSVTQPGYKRIIFAFTESVITTFHVTELKDPDRIGQEILGEEL